MLYAFDLLELNGKDLRPLPLGERKAKLAKLLAGAAAGIVFNEHTSENGATGHRIQAAERTLSIRAVTRLDQGQEPGQPRDDPSARGAVAIGPPLPQHYWNKEPRLQGPRRWPWPPSPGAGVFFDRRSAI
jgi:hypothetical protein